MYTIFIPFPPPSPPPFPLPSPPLPPSLPHTGSWSTIHAVLQVTIENRFGINAIMQSNDWRKGQSCEEKLDIPIIF